jgi:hypothetical protein
MDTRNVKIGELRFELIIPDDTEDAPVFEIENDASMVYETVDVNKALQLRKLLDDFISEISDS